MPNLQGKTLFITGSSRGIGKAIAIRAAQDGANVAVIGKSDKEHEKLPGTVHSAVAEINEQGGQAIPCICDIRFEDQVAAAVEKTTSAFGGIDIVVNNASAIFLANTAETPMKRFDLMHGVNARGTYLVSQQCLPQLSKSGNPHILNISPPLNMESKWFAPHVAYTMAKFGMSMCVLGMAEEFNEKKIAVNALWPQTAIATAAIQNILGGDAAMKRCRKPEIMADAAHWILTQASTEVTGQFLIDENVLRQAGETDFDQYACTPGSELIQDFFI